MTLEKIQFSITLVELTELIRISVRQELNEVLKGKAEIVATPKFYTREEAANLLKISLVTLDNYTKLKIIQAKKLGNRILYTEREIDKALINIRK